MLVLSEADNYERCDANTVLAARKGAGVVSCRPEWFIPGACQCTGKRPRLNTYAQGQGKTPLPFVTPIRHGGLQTYFTVVPRRSRYKSFRWIQKIANGEAFSVYTYEHFVPRQTIVKMTQDKITKFFINTAENRKYSTNLIIDTPAKIKYKNTARTLRVIAKTRNKTN